jgi:hypothetical protein
MKLAENNINKLYNEMVELIENRQETDKLQEMNIEDFTTWVEGLEKQYIEDEEIKDFYDYVIDWIYETVCYE